MTDMLDALARFGEIFWGLVALVLVIVLLVITVIELVDFLVVDPLSRKLPAKTGEDYDSEEEI